eukprot:COSAG06_NODE_25130_length_634_cov_1.036697_1_plen_161_part_01
MLLCLAAVRTVLYCIYLSPPPLVSAGALKVVAKQGARTTEKCAKHKSCEKCRKAGCGWCVARASCVLDQEMLCDGSEDHIGARACDTLLAPFVLPFPCVFNHERVFLTVVRMDGGFDFACRDCGAGGAAGMPEVTRDRHAHFPPRLSRRGRSQRRSSQLLR